MLSAHSLRKVGFVLLVIALMPLAAASAFAAAPAPPTATPVALGTGIGNWQVIDGQPLEYDFQYIGAGLPVQLMLGVDPAGSVGFNVYTEDQWRALANGNRGVMPVGRGTHNAYTVGDLFWQLVSPSSGRYHVQVFPTGEGTARFWIALTGAGASGLTPVSPPVEVPTSVPAAKPAAPTAKPAVVAGTAPTVTVAASAALTLTAGTPKAAVATSATLTVSTSSTVTLVTTPSATKATTATLAAAIAPTATIAPRATSPAPAPTPVALGTGIGNWQVIDGQPLEYDFQYIGAGLPVQLMLGVDPAGSVGFNVYTEDQWRALANGNRGVMPVGRGTHNAYTVGDLFWQLVSPSSGRYHVQVFPTGEGTARFWIALTGTGASGLTPVSPPVAAK